MAHRPLSRVALDYLEWICLPEHLRFPENKKAWADSRGVHQNTLQAWEKHPEFIEKWEENVKRAAQSPERTEQLLDMLFKRGLNGDTRSAELYLKATNQMPNPKQEINIKTEKTSELSDSELEALIAEYAQKESHLRKEEAKLNKDDINNLRDIIKDINK